MKNCPAVSQERVDLLLLLRAVKPRVDQSETFKVMERRLLRACLQRMPAIDYPA
jgi:hypothetical protein